MTLIAEALSVPRRDVRLVSGRGARDKILELSGLSAAVAEQRLASAVERR